MSKESDEATNNIISKSSKEFPLAALGTLPKLESTVYLARLEEQENYQTGTKLSRNIEIPQEEKHNSYFNLKLY